MRPFKYVVALVFVLLPALAFSEDFAPMRLGLADGGVQVMSKDTSEAWEPAGVNTPVGNGDRIWVPDDGRAELQISGNAYVRADANTSLDVLRASPDSVQFYAEGGHIYANNGRGGANVVQVDTPLASVRGYENSVFLLDVDGGTTELQVIKGGVYAENRLGSTKVEAGSALTIREDGSAEIAPIGQPDEWERWNVERDRTLEATGESARYLPEGLQEYSPEFDNYGRWGYDNDYGYVWFPAAAAGWAPYRDGRWKWAGGRYIWVSFEPWGWAPYHYGRWLFRTGAGWCWVPPGPGNIFWAPGYVGWVRTGSSIGWVPLAPGETYYGYGNYGPNSVNLINVDIHTVTVRKYRNADFPDAATFVRRDEFGGPVRKFEKPGKNPFRAPRFDFKPPERGPAPGTITGREAPIGQRPPERVINMRPEKLRQERTLVRERGQSAFKPEQPRPLEPKKSKEPKNVKRKPGQKREEKKEERR